jgi:cobalt-zinc-cadmium efflux system outer membrane protein
VTSRRIPIRLLGEFDVQVVIAADVGAFVFFPASAQTLDLPRSGDVFQASSDRPTKALEPSGPVTLQSALALALSANADLSAARYELSAVEASIVQAGVLPNPSLSAQMQDTRRDTRETTV